MKKKQTYKIGSMVLSVLMVCFAVLTNNCGKSDIKPGKTEILVGRVNPVTGPLANFGVGTPDIEERALEKINKDGGIFIKEYNKKLPIKLIVVDSESNPTKASESANKLILQDKVDIILVAHTPDTVNPVAAAAERNKIPCLSVDAPLEAFESGGPYKWSFHASFGMKSLNSVYLDAMDLKPTNKKIGFVLGNDIDGVLISGMLKKQAEERGYTVVDPGRYPAGTKDYTAVISAFKKEGVDIISGNQPPPDFATFIKQMHQQAFVPKMLLMGKASNFPSDIKALGGSLGNGIICEVWWSENSPYKSSLTGQSASELAEMFTKTTGKQVVAPIGAKHALIEIMVDVLKRAGTLDRGEIVKAIKATDLDTITGHIKYSDKNTAETPLVAGQWVKGKKYEWERIIISNKMAPEIPLSKRPMVFPLPGTTQK